MKKKFDLSTITVKTWIDEKKDELDINIFMNIQIIIKIYRYFAFICLLNILFKNKIL